MIAADLEAFRAALMEVAVVCGRHLTDDMVTVYFRILMDVDLESIQAGCRSFARTAETGRRMPSPRELREWCTRGARGPRGLTEAEASAVWRAVQGPMDDWERESRGGSAWPTFELTWRAATDAQGLRRTWTPQDRQNCWQRWLWRGAVRDEDAPIATREQVEQIYRDVAPRCSPLFAKVLRDIADRIHRAREAEARDPGEEG